MSHTSAGVVVTVSADCCGVAAAVACCWKRDLYLPNME